jgi:hypothetical protein
VKIRSVIIPFLFSSYLIGIGVSKTVSANDVIIDDRSSGNMMSTMGTEWRLVTDTVMGGLSTGNITVGNHKGKNCLHMRGNVTTENNGGFVQMALSLSEQDNFDASDFDGVEVEVSGNNELYNIHLRSAGLWFPWQSYRASFKATPDWQTLRIPFADFEAYKTSQDLRLDKLRRVGLLGIGRDFQADLCLASIRFYAN